MLQLSQLHIDLLLLPIADEDDRDRVAGFVVEQGVEIGVRLVDFDIAQFDDDVTLL